MLFRAWLRWRLWVSLGWNDVLQRYRRSSLGPLWLTASTAILVIALGLLYAKLFRAPVSEFMPYLCVGLIFWNYFSSFLLEAGSLFIGSESYIKQIRLPYTVYVYRSTWSKLIILAHNVVIYFGLIAYFQIWPGATALLAIPGILILTLNGALAGMLIGMISARFRDIPQLINSVVQIAFFVTPIMWKPDLLQEHIYLATWNPFHVLLEIVRAPLLGQTPYFDDLRDCHRNNCFQLRTHRLVLRSISIAPFVLGLDATRTSDQRPRAYSPRAR